MRADRSVLSDIVQRASRGSGHMLDSLLKHRRRQEVKFDYVVVGAGTAGCLVANRLSASGAFSVCVVEAGPADRHPFIHLPAGYIKTLFNPRYTWRFETEPSEGSAGRTISTTQGRTLGGSSSINGLVYNRGQASDYDLWAAMGNAGWAYRDVLPYFRRTERRIGVADEAFRGREGRLPVTDLDWSHPLCSSFLSGVQELGIPLNSDYNGAEQLGGGYYQRVIYKGRRWSSAVAFLNEARRRSNVTIITRAQASRILFKDRKAVGVEIARADGSRQAIEVNREVIVCSGAINSPKLLQLSGIGPAMLLGEMGIPVVHGLEGVGLNLRDHWAVRVVAKVKNARTINSLVKPMSLPVQVLRWLLGRPSVLTISPSLAHVFWKSEPSRTNSDLQFTFTPASYREGVAGLLDSYDGMTCGVWQQRPESSGFVRIRSADFRDHPRIQPNYLESEVDQRAIVAGIKIARQLLSSTPLRDYFDGHHAPGPEVQSDAELLNYARKMGSTVFHLMGSCRMGPASDPASVVDENLRVRGVAGLRVIDSSVMPTMPSANTMAASYLIGEKGAAAILEQR